MNSISQDWYKTTNPEEQKIFREWLQDLLKTEIICLTFRKKDDTIREMKCTLIDDVISVFDLEKNEWRSCRYDSINQINFTLGT